MRIHRKELLRTHTEHYKQLLDTVTIKWKVPVFAGVEGLMDVLPVWQGQSAGPMKVLDDYGQVVAVSAYFHRLEAVLLLVVCEA